MYLYFMVKILFFFLFELKEIDPSQAISLENDITKSLDKWISSILTFAIDPIKQDHIINFMMDRDRDFDNFEYDSKNASNHTERKIVEVIRFGALFNTNSTSDESASSPSDESTSSSSEELSLLAQVDFKFSSNHARLFYKQLVLNGWGHLKVKNNNTHQFAFDAYLSIKNACFNFTAFPSSTSSYQTNLTKISHEFSYSNIETEFEVPEWVTSSGKLRKIPDTAKEELKREVFPLVLHECFNNNQEALPPLNEIFQPLLQPKIELFSQYPDLLNNPEKFHYLIPRSPLLRFTLKRIVISGLSNLDSFKLRESNDIFTHTLHIKNIEGSMTLDYGSGDEAPLKMNFKIDHLFVMRKEETNCVSVQAKYCQITRAKGNSSLNARQSEVMMNGLTSAIASSILPSMKVGNVCGMKTPPEDIEIKNTAEWKTIKDSYKGYIPFNDDIDDAISAKFPFDVFNQ